MHLRNDEGLPFGGTDGTTAELRTYLSGLGNTIPLLDAVTPIRIFAGAKGTGKSFGLRHLKEMVSLDDENFVDDIQRDVPSTADVENFTSLFSERYVTEEWSRAWYYAILNSVSSQILYNPAIRIRLKKSSIEALEPIVKGIYTYKTPVSITSQLTYILTNQVNEVEIRKYFDRNNWSEYESLLKSALEEIQPLYLFMDSVDEHYHRSPYSWMRSQKGLFYCLRSLSQDKSKIGDRLRISVAIRDHVIFDIFRTGQASNLISVPLLKVLIWDDIKITNFLSMKVSQLQEEYLFDKAQNSLSNWLGINEIEVNGKLQSVEEFVLSHTRLIPRDIVTMGNTLAEEVRRAKSYSYSSMRTKDLKRVVFENAIFFGQEQLSLAWSYIQAILGNTSYNGQSYDQVGRSQVLYQVLRPYGHRLFGQRELAILKSKSEQYFGSLIDFLTILYQNRILGYVDHDHSHFYTGSLPPNNLPLHADQYILHPTISMALGSNKLIKN